MERAEAYKTLRLDQSADAQMVEKAYWTLVRQAQGRAGRSNDAGHEIDRLNDAYATLAPEDLPLQPMRASGAPAVSLVDNVADWMAHQALMTRRRWSRRNPEIALIGGATVVLMVLALGAGASLFATFIATALVCVAIWAPWRRVPRDDNAPE
jgi:hypothetical protein